MEISEKIPVKEKLLLHVCCAPDATAVVERLSGSYSVIAFFYNPCIHPEEEYRKRLSEAKKVAEIMGFELIEGEYDVKKWEEEIRGLEDEPEGGKRCWRCYHMRLERTSSCARQLGIKLFTTTLSISPHKNFEKIREIGDDIARMNGLRFIGENFKKMDGFKRSVELSRSLGLYRQNYCGCRFSMRKR